MMQKDVKSFSLDHKRLSLLFKEANKHNFKEITQCVMENNDLTIK